MYTKTWKGLLLVAILALGTLSCRVTQQFSNRASGETPTVEASETAGPGAAVPPKRTPTPIKAGEGPLGSVLLARDPGGQDPSETFGQGDPVYLYGTLDAPQGANLKTVWTAVETEDNPPDTPVYEFPEQSYQSGPFWFRLEWPRPWSFGSYQVDLYVDGELERSLSYRVEQTNPDGDTIEEPFLALSEDAAQVAEAFGPGDSFFVHFNLTAAAADTPVRVIWIAKQVEGLAPNSYLNEYTALMNSGPNWLNIVQAQPWAAGEYQADLYLNSQLEKSLAFSVQSTNTGGAAFSSAFLSNDEAGAQTTETFGTADSVYVHFSLAGLTEEANVAAAMAAVNAAGEHTFIDRYRESFSDGDYFIFFTPDGAWTPGTYVIYLYLNGDLAETLNLDIQ
ncbi:MAG: hypothetical protein ACKOC5_02620 [Chloroflexota bacterium]